MRKRALQSTLGELLELGVKLRVDPARRVNTEVKFPRSAEAEFPSFCVFRVRAGSVAEGLLFRPPSFFGGGGMIGAFAAAKPGRAPLRTLVALEQTGAEHTVPVLRNVELDRADPASSKTACSSPTGSPNDPKSARSSQRPAPPSSLPRESSAKSSAQDREPCRRRAQTQTRTPPT